MDGRGGPLPASAPPRACQTCATAKSKCVPQPGASTGPCARCFRLKKECIPAVAIAKRKKPAHRPTRTSQLQEKLDSIVSLLSASKQPHSANPGSTKATPENRQSHERSSGGDPAKPGSDRAIVEAVAIYELESLDRGVSDRFVDEAFQFIEATVQRVPRPTSHVPVDSRFSANLEPTAVEAVEALNRFKTLFALHFPFVVVATEKSAQELKLENPHLYRSIMMVTAYDKPVRQIAMRKEILIGFSTRLLIKVEKSLDLLQGMLVYNAWHYYLFNFNPALTNILQLTIGLMFDLGLKSPRFDETEEVFSYSLSAGTDSAKKEKQVEHEQRAYLGCFVLASTVSTCFKKTDGLRYSPYIETCCESLLLGSEQPSDQFLVATVRLQCIIEKMQDGFSSRDFASGNPKAPFGMHVNLLRAELHAFKSSQPLAIQQNANFAMHYYGAEILLYESSIQKSSNSVYGNHSVQRVDMLWACLVSCQSFFENYLTLSPSWFCCLTILDFGHVALALVSIFKLLLLEAPGWDLTQVRQTVNITLLLDRLAERFLEASAVVDPKQQMNRTDSFSLCARKLRLVKGWSDKKVMLQSGAEQPQEAFNMSGLVDFDLWGTFNQLDETSWREMMGGLDAMPWANESQNPAGMP